MPELRVLALYHDLMNICADGGNLHAPTALRRADLEGLAHLEARHAAGI